MTNVNLDSIRVLDLTRLLPGPYGSQLLADMGAEVVKVEDPDHGDYTRFMPPTTPDDVGGLFDVVNRGKKSITLDLKTDAGQQVFYRLVEDADVVFEQFRPGVAERLGVAYEDVTEYNSDVVYCSLSGYGQAGPYCERAGHDLNYVGIAGLLDMTRGSEDEVPTLPGYLVSDLAGGLFATLGIVGALLDRELGEGGGTYLDVSMTDAVLSFSQATMAVSESANPRPGETFTTGAFPWYDVYETADGRYVTLAALEPKFWANFCEAVDREDLVGEHTVDPDGLTDERYEELRAAVADVFASKTRDEWAEELADEDAMVAKVNTVAEAYEDPQIQSRNLIERSDGSFPRVRSPAGGDERRNVDGHLPGMGEHTAEILLEAGFNEDDLDELDERDVI